MCNGWPRCSWSTGRGFPSSCTTHPRESTRPTVRLRTRYTLSSKRTKKKESRRVNGQEGATLARSTYLLVAHALAGHGLHPHDDAAEVGFHPRVAGLLGKSAALRRGRQQKYWPDGLFCSLQGVFLLSGMILEGTGLTYPLPFPNSFCHMAAAEKGRDDESVRPHGSIYADYVQRKEKDRKGRGVCFR